MAGQVKVASGMGVAHQLHRSSSYEGVMLRAKESRHDCVMVWYMPMKLPKFRWAPIALLCYSPA